MATAVIKKAIEQYFITNWTTTSIQFDGVPFSYDGLTQWISIVYTPAYNSVYASCGTRAVLNEGVLKVFCYAKSVPLSFKLADSITSAFNELVISGVEIGIGSLSASLNLDTGYFEVPVTFNTRYYA